MTAYEALQKGTNAIGQRDARLLWQKANAEAGDSSIWLLDNEKTLSPAVAAAYTDLLAARLSGKPVQYILGEWEFMGLPFTVNPSVLIPRADTEILVEILLAYIHRQPPKAWKILDMCTGSGCIGIAAACFCKEAQVTLSDISPEALAVAAENAARNGVADRMRFIVSDLFNAIDGQFDIITANPPYILSGEMDTLPEAVRAYEPHTALDGGADGLAFYRPLIARSGAFLHPGGALLLEVGPADAVAAMMRAQGFANAVIVPDYAGLHRVVWGTADIAGSGET